MAAQRTVGERNRLVVENLGLISHLCRIIRPSVIKKVGAADFYQAAATGLIEAADLWEPERGSFANWALRRMRWSVLRWWKRGRLIHAPSPRESRRLKSEQLRRLARDAQDVLTLGRRQQYVPDEAEAGEVFPDRREVIARALQLLTARRRRAVELRFGLDDGRERTLQEVGNALGVGTERARQIILSALRKLSTTSPLASL